MQQFDRETSPSLNREFRKDWNDSSLIILARRSLLLFGLVSWLFVSCLGCWSAKVPNGETSAKEFHSESISREVVPGNILFHKGAVHVAQIRFSDKDRSKLVGENRPYVLAALKFDLDSGGHFIMDRVGFKLKGAAGSYQEFDGKPGFTAKLDRSIQDQSIDGEIKFHLNNSVQDATYLSEWLGAQIFASVGYPVARVAHCVVQQSDRHELYVLREAYDERFMKGSFGSLSGNLYEGGFVQDIDSSLEKDAGWGVEDHSDLIRVVEACRWRPYSERISKLSEVVDLDRLLTFVALERMICHWDGYSCNRNNYRVYVDANSRKLTLLPHGMDQLYGQIEMPMWDDPNSILTAQLLGSDQLRKSLRARTRELLPFVAPDKLIKMVDEMASKLRPHLAPLVGEKINQWEQEVESLKERIANRFNAILEQLEIEDLPLDGSKKNEIELNSWWEDKQNEEIVSSVVESETEHLRRMELASENPGNARWSTSLWLAKGRYRWTGRVQIKGVFPMDSDEPFLAVSVGEVVHARNGAFFSDNQLDDIFSSREESGFITFQVEFQIEEDRRKIDLFVEVHGNRWEVILDERSKLTRE